MFDLGGLQYRVHGSAYMYCVCGGLTERLQKKSFTDQSRIDQPLLRLGGCDLLIYGSSKGHIVQRYRM
jgi:hypothetical protein